MASERRSSPSARTAATTSPPARLSAAIAAATPSGPTSRNVVTPASASVVTASAKRTASRACRTQYSGDVTVGGPPPTAETSGIDGSASSSPATTRPNSASIGSISGEWKACETASRLVFGEVLPHRQHRGFGAGDDDRPRPVDGGDHGLVAEQRDDLFLVRHQGQHRAAGRQRLHQPAARGDQPARLRRG